ILHLHQAPVVTAREVRQDRAQPSSDPVQDAVQGLGAQAVGHLLGAAEVLDLDEDVSDQSVADSLPAQLASQPVMPIEIELQAERRPSGNPQIAEPQVLVNKVEVVVQASP